jgi:hypothetical protein
MKLSGLTIIVIGLCLGLSLLSYAFFQVYQPNEVAAGYMKTYHDQLQDEANLQPMSVKKVQTAMGLVSGAAVAWNQYVSIKTPTDINIFENPYQLVVDTPKYRDRAQKALNAQYRVGGVKVLQAPEIPQPTDSEKDILVSYFNYPAFTFPVVLWELGSVTVEGTYDQIVKNVRAWSAMPHYLAVVDGLRIDGTSPVLTASYNVTVVGFIQANKIYPPPAVATDTGASGTPGTTSQRGGGPPSMPGGPGTGGVPPSALTGPGAPKGIPGVPTGPRGN